MKIAFRVDASLQIGTGHVMRCLTLADALTSKDAKCIFICRSHEGNLIELIRSKGYVTHALQIEPERNHENGDSTYSEWLGSTQERDAELCSRILSKFNPEWLIVDHYALDIRWEKLLITHYRKLMVIDDLADRKHSCHLLLDQNLGRDPMGYKPFVPSDCNILCGAHYALLRPEFAELRPYSLKRRAQPELRNLLISMGGVDKGNATGRVLQALNHCSLPADCRITVVMGATAPWLDDVTKQAQQMPWPTQVLVGVGNIAQLMTDSDLAIGAAGSTSWELCCLGIPSILICTANNQRSVIAALSLANATVKIDLEELNQLDLFQSCIKRTKFVKRLQELSNSASRITDGTGASRVCAELLCLT